MKPTLKIGVRSLVTLVYRSGDLENTLMSQIRPVDAIYAHQKVQKSRPGNYTPEVTVSHQVETELFVLEIGGRIDGVFVSPQKITIEEIKTTVKKIEIIKDNINLLHWAQVKTYAFIYALTNDLTEIDLQLTYYQMDSGEIVELCQRCAFDELSEFFDQIIQKYIRWTEPVLKWEQIRNDSIGLLEFPFHNYRPGQRTMAVEVYRTIRDDGQLVIQASTGIGKTMATIFPAIKAMEAGYSKRIFYLSARTTGKKIAEKALETLRENGLRLKSLTITAKEKICFNPEAACTPEECEFAKGYYDRLNEALAAIFDQEAFSKEVIENVSFQYKVCPFEFSLDLSLWADVIICDYNYAFDPRVFLKRFFLEIADSNTFLVDEAHNLVDRSRDMFSAQIGKQIFLDTRRPLREELSHIYSCMGRINLKLGQFRKECKKTGGIVTQKEAPESLYPLLKKFIKKTERWLRLNIKTPFRQSLLELYFEVNNFLKISDGFDENYTTCFEKDGKELKVKLFCMNPSDQMKKALGRCRSAIFFSATMTPSGYFRKLFGCKPSARQLTLPSPFPRQNLGLFIWDKISTLYKRRESTKEAVNHAILTLVNQKMGNYLVFFPSFAYMHMIKELFEAEFSEKKLIVQQPFMTESDRDLFISQFKMKNSQTVVGFAVMGGIFGEGIDLVGNRLSGAAIVGVGLPGICVERDLIRDHFLKLNNKGFEYGYLYPGINRVLQAAGRVIRSELDRGVVLLIDERFSRFQYRSLLPKEWHPVTVHDRKEFENHLHAFWKS